VPVNGETFRKIMGCFPAGVTVVTTVAEDGSPRGLTSSAVCAVSLEPPLLLICVDRSSATLPSLRTHGSFVVNFLAEGQEAVARRFALKGGPDKFRGVAWRASEAADGAPILGEQSAAYAECVTQREIEAGDHIVFIASIEAGDAFERAPLVFRRGIYRGWALETEAKRTTTGTGVSG